MLRKNGVVNRKINLIYYNILVISRCITFTAMVINDIHSKLNIYICKPFESKITFQFNFQFTFISSSLIDIFFFHDGNLGEYLSKWQQPSKSIDKLIYSDYLFTFLLYVQSLLCFRITEENFIPFVFPGSLLLKFKFIQDSFNFTREEQ